MELSQYAADLAYLFTLLFSEVVLYLAAGFIAGSSIWGIVFSLSTVFRRD